MISFHWTEPPNVSDLPNLMANYQMHGGAIVEYQHIASFIFISRKTFHYEWVSPGGSRLLLGLKHSLFCCLFGWWSFFGLVWTPAAVISNLLGGVDLTKALVSQMYPATSGPQDDVAREIMATRKRHMWVFIVVLALLTTFLAIKYLRPH